MHSSAKPSSSGRAVHVSTACLALVALLAGCAGTSSADAPAAPAPAAAATRPAPAPAAPRPAPAVAPPEQRNPVVVDFPARSVLLTEDARALLPQVAARAKAASSIQVMGLCDKAQAPNAREIAIGRGIAVRNELVRLGVPAAKLKVRFTTTEPNRHAVELTFDDAGSGPGK
jgi:outer membrane protein OmpA-like peptidoglycan-associated protein